MIRARYFERPCKGVKAHTKVPGLVAEVGGQ